MKRHFYPAVVITAGVLSAEFFFSILVYSSNISLYQNLQGIQDSGYVFIPNALIMPSLLDIMPAVCGGLFFALTTGAGLALMSFLCVCIWRHYFNQYRLLLVFYIFISAFWAIKLNNNLPVTLACILTIGMSILAALKFFPDADERGYSFIFISVNHLVVLILVGFIWLPVMNRDVFVSIRDNLLLSNPIGQKINDFYYKYTLYPAETFKSLDQKLLKSCHIHIHDKNRREQIKQKLIAQDYLPVKEKFPADLTVGTKKNDLVFLLHEKIIHQCSFAEFKKNTQKILHEISKKTDQNKLLRTITFFSLIVASPIICFLFLHAFFMLGFYFLKSKICRMAGASISCLLLFSLPAISFYHQPVDDTDVAKMSSFLKSDNRQDRIAALKNISDQGLRIERYINPDRLIYNSSIVERYWLAKALSSSRTQESYQMILRLLGDTQPNVVCMAMYSLGKRNHLKKNKKVAVNEILRRIKTSGQWYVQWYAYKALKRLGWTQGK